MAGVSVKLSVKIGKRIAAHIDNDTIEGWLFDRLNDARNAFIMHATEGGSGRTYGGHVASAPGEYPQSVTGQLANSIDPQIHDSRSGTLTSDVVYAGFLTSGTSIMAPRQMLADVLEEVIDERPNKDRLARAVKIGAARAI